jgi:PAS domain S-box-containing protein
MEKSIRETIRTGTSTHPDPVNYRFHRPDGTVAIARQTVFVVKSLRGNMIGTLYQDVTEQQRAEEKVKESEESYRGLFNTIRQALYLLDREGKFIDVNAGAETMYGYTRDEFAGRTPEFLSAPGKNDLSAVAEKIQKAFTGEPQQFEFWGLRRNGEVFPKDVFLYRGTYFGKDIVLAAGIDITERRLAENALRESENKFSTVFRSNPVTLTLVSATDGRFVDVNDAFVANTGYSREDRQGSGDFLRCGGI